LSAAIDSPEAEKGSRHGERPAGHRKDGRMAVQDPGSGNASKICPKDERQNGQEIDEQRKLHE